MWPRLAELEALMRFFGLLSLFSCTVVAADV